VTPPQFRAIMSVGKEIVLARTLTKEEIFDLSVTERIELIETLWDSIDPNQLAVPESHRRALDESLADYRRDPDEGRSWDQVRDELFPKR
jgi:putative addiction module component (TIGR02574 family)